MLFTLTCNQVFCDFKMNKYFEILFISISNTVCIHGYKAQKQQLFWILNNF